MTRKLTFLILALFALIAGPGWGQNYVKVTSTGDLTDGQYLIVYETGNVALNGMLTADAAQNTVAVTISNNTIESTPAIDAAALTFTASNGSFLGGGGKYIGHTGSSNTLNYSGSPLENVVSFDGYGNVVITAGDYVMRFNKSSGQERFRYYKSGQEAIQLYKQSTSSKTLTSLAISGTPTKTRYEAGESFDPAGLVVTGTYDDESQETITSGITWNVTPNPLTAGTTSVSATATVSGITSTAYQVNGLTVTAALPKITITAEQVIDFTNSYKEYTWTASDISGKLYAYKANGMQFNTSKDGYYVYNTDPIPGNIRSIKMTTHSAGTEREWKVSVGTSRITSISGDAGTEETKTVTKAGTTWTISGDNQYFCLVDKSGASNISEIVITYEASTEPSITVEETLNIAHEGTGGEEAILEVAYQNIDFENIEIILYKDAVCEEVFTDDWFIADFDANHNIGYIAEANTATAERTVYMKIYALGTDGEHDVTKVITVTQAAAPATYNVNLNSNGVVTSDQVYAGVIQLTAPTNIPNGYTYVGWTDEPITGIAQTATYFSSYNVTENVYLYAVFAIETKGGNSYRLSSTAPVAGDNVIVAGKKDGKYYALSTELSATELTIANGVVTNYEGCIWSASYDDYNETYGIVLNNGTNPLHMNSSALKVASSNQNGTFEFPVSGDGFNIYGNQNIRWMTFNGTTFGVTSEEASASTLYFFMPVSFSNFCTTVNDLSGTITQSNITANTAYYISGNASISSAVEIAALGNTNASLLIINDGGQLICNNAVKATVQKTIAGHSGEDATGGWNFIATPIVDGSAVSAVQNGTYDLYRFNQDAEQEWENVKAHSTDFTTLNNGTGYLYANSEDVTLEFAGTLYNGNGEFPLTYSQDVNFAGWNLMGNPFPCNVTLTGSYYVMNADRDEVVSATDPTIAPCEGYFAIANAPQQTVAMTKGTATSSRSTLTASISKADVRGNANVDRAIVSFDEINALPKFNLNADNSKLYIPQDGKNYAVVFAANEGTLPLNFEVKENGTYTITVNTENIDAEYLHLIDNMTGMDVDLLTTDSYTFEAKDTDYTSRFKLVFDVKNEASAGSDSNFAYMSDGNLVISDIEGQATLQIVDMMGRVLSTETVSGNYCKALNLKAGVYVLNLNGMTQKIVVE